jgi:adenylate kinase family enzyme
VTIGKAKRISVIGNSGAGKSTLSKKLGESVGLEVYSIDKIYWLSGWKLRDQNSYNRLHNKWLEKDSWIIEGVGYLNEMLRRISESDTVIFLDVSVDICKERVRNRIKEESISPNLNITSGCVYSEMKDRQMEVIEYFHNDMRPKILEYLSRLSWEKVKIVSDYSELNMGNET